MTDAVIEELHETRRAISEKFHGDTAAIAADAAARQSASGRPVWHAKTPNKSQVGYASRTLHYNRHGR